MREYYLWDSVNCPVVQVWMRGIVGYTSPLAGELMTTSPQCPGYPGMGIKIDTF